MKNKKDDSIFLTQEAINSLKLQLNDLLNVQRPNVIQEIKESRALGDLSENAEYDAAREKQGQIEDKIREIEQILETAQVLKTSRTDIVSLGSTVELLNKDKNEKITIKIVQTHEADPFENKVSNIAPLAIAIMDKQVGDIVHVESQVKYEVEILKIS